MMDPQSAYRESAARGATAVGQVVQLYEQMLKDLRLAVLAIEASQIEERTKAINHALLVVSHMQGSLNFELGGDVAPQLERFYNMMRRRLTQAQFQTSKEILNEQIALLLELRDAWIEVDRSTAAGHTPLPETALVSPDDAPHAASEWNA